MDAPWKDYQEEAASFFRSLGLEAATDVSVPGIRTPHDIDVLVKSRHVGFEFIWLVECKLWKTRVSKAHVLALRSIVTDLGADRGIMLAEQGYQKGAIEAAESTNVQVTSLQKLRVDTKSYIYSRRLRELSDRIEECSDRYWEIPKADRTEYGLRPDAPQIGYSGYVIVRLCRDLLSRGLRGRFPVESDFLYSSSVSHLPREFASAEEIVDSVEPLVIDLERRLTICEARLSAG